eukprot:CAMPEP_0196574900 /NCGR_PEP_ID=MMETSP1081-20130531/4508_1 /TAXON_ID=36882 /ORGANISM="Pyramimonas amylifera, Strain CCMP720" /LENGTH=327 /DNA_ID=CAMNT_0041893045 /DNA_START=26 /DNA_END=1009 /DNA_ORIENTATION=-
MNKSAVHLNFQNVIANGEAMKSDTTKLNILRSTSCQVSYFPNTRSARCRSFYAQTKSKRKASSKSRKISKVLCFSFNVRNTVKQEAWDRIQLLEREMILAVKEEKYDEAARLRDERQTEMASWSDDSQELLKVVKELRIGNRDSRAGALEELESYRDHRSIPAILEVLRDPDPKLSAQAEKVLWNIFCHSGDNKVDKMLQEGMMAMQMVSNLENAENIFSKVIENAPDFGEAFNKRATVRYLRKDFEGAVEDCIAALSLQPDHFGALSGQGLCHLAMNQPEEALSCLRRAVFVNPRLDQIRAYVADLDQVVEEKRRRTEDLDQKDSL